MTNVRKQIKPGDNIGRVRMNNLKYTGSKVWLLSLIYVKTTSYDDREQKTEYRNQELQFYIEALEEVFAKTNY